LFLFVIPITYVLFVGVPFFALGLHEQPVDLVASGAFDPGGLPFYLTPIGQMIHLVGFCSVFPGFVCLPSLNIPLIWVLLRRWTHWSRWQRRLGLLAVLVSFFTLGLMFLPPGRVIVAWFLD
jgi:hypothetical protein